MEDYIHEALSADVPELEKVQRVAEVLRKNPSLWPVAIAANIVAVRRLTDLLAELTKALTSRLRR